MVRFLTVFSVYEKKVEKSQINHLPFLLKLNPRVFSYPCKKRTESWRMYLNEENNLLLDDNLPSLRICFYCMR